LKVATNFAVLPTWIQDANANVPDCATAVIVFAGVARAEYLLPWIVTAGARNRSTALDHFIEVVTEYRPVDVVDTVVTVCHAPLYER
jgi:hypothetical protein